MQHFFVSPEQVRGEKIYVEGSDEMCIRDRRRTTKKIAQKKKEKNYFTNS